MTWEVLPAAEPQDAAPPAGVAAAKSVAVETGRLQRLEGKRTVAAARLSELQGEREALAWSAHAEGDKKAKARLDQIHRDIAVLTVQLESHGSAIVVQQSRIAQARDAEA